MLEIEPFIQEHMEQREKMRELETRRDYCMWTYMGKHNCLKEHGDKVIEAFYKTDDPESLMEMELPELLKMVSE